MRLTSQPIHVSGGRRVARQCGDLATNVVFQGRLKQREYNLAKMAVNLPNCRETIPLM
jgi:hypothetical protein